MSTYNDLPVFYASVEESGDGLRYISLVDDPAIKRDFIAMNAAREVALVSIASEEKRLVYGALLRADFPVYRNDRERGEYYIVFTPQAIRQAVEKFFADKMAGNVNLMHRPGSDVEGVHLVQLFIKDSAHGVSPAGFEEIEEGSLFGEYHVADDAVWSAIKAGKYRGFSIEGIFTFNKSPNNQTIMSKLEKFKSQLAKLLVQLGAASTDKGALFWDGDEDLKAGDSVYIDQDGERKPAPDGDYKTEDDKTVRVAGGKVSEILDPKAEIEGAGVTPPNNEGHQGGAGDGGAGTEGNGHLDELRKRIDKYDERLGEIEAMLNKIVKALDAAHVQMRALRKTPAAEPAHTAFSTAAAAGKTGNHELDRLAEMLG